MFFILSKTLDFLLKPIVWVFILLIFALLHQHSKRKLLAYRLAFGLLLVLSNPFLINQLLLWWETPAVEIEALEQTYEVGIVLSGITNNRKSPDDRVYLDAGADRLMHALQLYRMGKIKKILITGATIFVSGEKQVSEARKLAQVLRLCQVPASDIILEENARNTRENALFSKEILEKQFPDQAYLLITSAFHMPRALGCFRQVGLEPQPFSAGFYTIDADRVGLGSFIPDEHAIYLWFVLVHEIVGYWVYGLMGYLG